MDKEKLAEIITKPVLVIVLIVLTLGSVVTYAVINNITTSKADIVSNLDIDEISTDADTGKLTAKLVDYEQKQKDNYKKVTEGLEQAANPEKAITDKIDKYIMARYSFDGKLKDNREKILEIIKDIASDDFKDFVKDDIDDNKNSESSECVIVKKFINARKMEILNGSTNELVYFYIVSINDSQKVIQFNVISVGGEWEINAQKTLTTIEEEIE